MTRRRIKKRELDNERIAAAPVPAPVVLPKSVPELPSVCSEPALLSETPVLGGEQATASAVKKTRKKTKKKSKRGN